MGDCGVPEHGYEVAVVPKYIPVRIDHKVRKHLRGKLVSVYLRLFRSRVAGYGGLVGFPGELGGIRVAVLSADKYGLFNGVYFPGI